MCHSHAGQGWEPKTSSPPLVQQLWAASGRITLQPALVSEAFIRRLGQVCNSSWEKGTVWEERGLSSRKRHQWMGEHPGVRGRALYMRLLDSKHS